MQIFTVTVITEVENEGLERAVIHRSSTSGAASLLLDVVDDVSDRRLVDVVDDVVGRSSRESVELQLPSLNNMSVDSTLVQKKKNQMMVQRVLHMASQVTAWLLTCMQTRFGSSSIAAMSAPQMLFVAMTAVLSPSMRLFMWTNKL